MNKDQVKTLKRLFNFVLTRHRNSCIVVLLLIIVSTIANVSGSIFIKSLIDDYITPYINSANPNFAPLLNAIIRMIAIYAIGVLATYGFNRILINVSQGSLKEIRDSMFEHMEKLPIRYFDTHNHGDIMSIYTNDADTLRQMISQSVPQVIVSGITILSVFVSMIIISVPLTCISVFMVIVMLFVSKHVTSRSGKYFYQQQINLGKVNGFIEEMMEGQKVVKVFTHEEEAKKDFDKVNEELFESAYEANKYANILMPLIGNLGYVSYVLVALIGGVLAINGYTNLSIGALASFLQLNRSFNNPIGQISQQVNMVLMALAGASRIFALLDEEVEKDEGHVTLVNAKENEDGTLSPVDYRTGVWAWEHRRPDGSIEYVRLVGDVRFHDVTFGYNENKTILYDMNLFAKPGEKLAFVGATGAGKTTITNLINRFYDIQKGSIIYDGIDIKLIKKADLRRSLGIVLQDTHLFTGTIMDNIRYGKLDATDEECIAAAKLANAHEFIMHLEHGYQTVLSGDGSSLSQGQCQLLAIARAAVANPPVLILDEATSSIDTRTESIVQSGMDKLMEGRTVFVIAHRLSTIKNSDAIMVLDQGRIIERGDHDKLIGQKGTYYQLYTGGLELD
ncbi:ABC transporter ATP-binding protein [Thomasclavelia spiroformis]|uniref:ABC transporter ATP-binding protein/permease n=1 Tax=Thomasclavelia spiroformis TaxID=29348 RepID=A0A921KIV6_9FIRM|nr:ABC transporter ATP-binding protein [Thomasclavelia spiroformis]HJF40643.1 ABC transporter ATP-binding protein/permease [Thomasclavelia spiroformis]